MFNPLRAIANLWRTTSASTSAITQPKPVTHNNDDTISDSTADPGSTRYPTLPVSSTSTRLDLTCSRTTPSSHSQVTQSATSQSSVTNGGATLRCINNVPAHCTRLFPAHDSTAAQSTQSTQVDDIDIPDVTFGTSPKPLTASSNVQNTPFSSPKCSHPCDVRQPTVEDVTEGDHEVVAISTPYKQYRPLLRPKRQQDIRRKPTLPVLHLDASASSIVQEKDSEADPLPEGYSGTWDGKRFYTPESYTEEHECGFLNEHQLICGH